MKPVLGVSALLCLALGVSAQTVTRSFGSVVFPGGTSATTPGVTRNFGSVVFPGGAAVPTVHTSPVQIGVPRSTVRPAVPSSGQNFRRSSSTTNRVPRNSGVIYSYPVFVGNYADTPSVVAPENAAPPAEPVMMYPASSPRPVMIQVAPDSYAARGPEAAAQTAAPEETTDHYLLAFKDHTVYTAVAYWFDGDTLHYFTTGSNHNQASVALLDKDLTARLNKEMGNDFKLPDEK